MFEAAELRAKDAEILSAVRRALAADAEVDDETASVKALVASLRSDHVIATSKRLHADYDRDHPERIACMLFRRDSASNTVWFLVIVNNRKYDVANMIKVWLRDDEAANKECSTCFKGVGNKTRVWRCCYCQNTTCAACHAKLCEEHAGAVQCTVCRQWCLDGSGPGAPRSWLDISPPPNGKKAAAALVELLSGLDGEVSVVPRLGNSFLIDREERFHRHTGRRPKPPGSDVRRRLARLLEVFPILSFHVFRKTFDIDPETNRPVMERSVLCSAPDGSLLQVPNDAWIDVFGSEKPFVHRKVEYLEPADFRPREDLRALFLDELPSRFPGASVFVVVRFLRSKTLEVSYDTGADGRPTTMTEAALLWLLAHVAAIPTARSASVRVLDGDTNAELLRTEFLRS